MKCKVRSYVINVLLVQSLLGAQTAHQLDMLQKE